MRSTQRRSPPSGPPCPAPPRPAVPRAERSGRPWAAVRRWAGPGSEGRVGRGPAGLGGTAGSSVTSALREERCRPRGVPRWKRLSRLLWGGAGGGGTGAGPCRAVLCCRGAGPCCVAVQCCVAEFPCSAVMRRAAVPRPAAAMRSVVAPPALPPRSLDVFCDFVFLS